MIRPGSPSAGAGSAPHRQPPRLIDQFAALLPPGAECALAQVVGSGAAAELLDAGSFDTAETCYERVTGSPPRLTVERIHPTRHGHGRAVFSGVWCPRLDPAADTDSALRNFADLLVPHGALCLGVPLPSVEPSETEAELAARLGGALRDARFHAFSLTVQRAAEGDAGLVRALAIRKGRCCADGWQVSYDRHALS
ncbi:hypothetical protein SAMN05216223_101691 [Actinacidiphila yanglinensis]|uniref:Uncharacterized protein n=1 Tax=Actinacidiphila yanglinensis TaxID=310779 RepID=A0A1H5TXV8_9ACTN|nr:hypothetical protein [Actinacidiphila yanglinensis]SEF67636.1 hypothetical protein SAMN05216223_101691 [Actinacidiphila yanglinensis]